MSNLKLLNLIDIKTVETKGKGSLSFFEANHNIPFSIKRIYYIYKVPEGIERGGHAHKKLKQLLFCPYGKIRIGLDDGKTKESVLLDSPSIGLIVEGLVWRTMNWEMEQSVLVVAASEYYDESDYIRDYEVFKRVATARSEN